MSSGNPDKHKAPKEAIGYQLLGVKIARHFG